MKLYKNKMAHDKDYIRLISSVRWRKLRRDKLAKMPICERCQQEGKITPATEVHHIRPVETALTLWQKQSLMFDEHNLLSLCHDCHRLIHKEMKQNSKEASKQREENRLEQFVQRFLL